jgi:alpha-1,3-rhamnosyltransferase
MPPNTEAQRQIGTQQPSLSILVLTYNHAEYIEQCLLSLLAIEFLNFHIWVLDDGSTDLTADLVRRTSDTHGRITLLTQPHSKGRTAQNLQRLIDTSSGEYIMFMAGDDMLGPAFSAKNIVEYLEQNPKTGFVLPRAVPFNQSPLGESPLLYDKNFMSILQSGNPKFVCRDHLHRVVSGIFIQGMIIRRTLVEECGGFDVELTADDYAFVCRLFFLMEKTDWNFKFFPSYFWLYRIHCNNVHKNPVRQIKIISETVGKYIPSEFWDGFNWHIPPVQKAEDLPLVEGILLDNLSQQSSSKVLRKVIRRSFESWFSTGRFSDIKKAFLNVDLVLVNRISIVTLLLLALPFVLIAVMSKFSHFSRAVHKLSNFLERQ